MHYAFDTEIQDGRQKWRENDFGQNSPLDSADALQIKNFVEIVLSHTVSKINAFLHFTQKFKTAAKNDGKTIFGKSRQYIPQIACGSKISLKSLYLAPFPREMGFAFYAEIQNGRQKWWQKFKMTAKNVGKTIFGKSRQ